MSMQWTLAILLFLTLGGTILGYCGGGPPIVTGVCCVFQSRSCNGDQTVSEKTTYFKNKYSHVPEERPLTFIRHLKKFSYFFPYFYQKFHCTLIPTHTFPKLLASFSWGSLFTL